MMSIAPKAVVSMLHTNQVVWLTCTRFEKPVLVAGYCAEEDIYEVIVRTDDDGFYVLDDVYGTELPSLELKDQDEPAVDEEDDFAVLDTSDEEDFSSEVLAAKSFRNWNDDAVGCEN